MRIAQAEREILGQPELTPFRLTNKEAEPSGTIFVFVRGCKRGQFYSTLGEFGLLYRGYCLLRARRFRLASPIVTLELALSRMLNEAITYSK